MKCLLKSEPGANDVSGPTFLKVSDNFLTVVSFQGMAELDLIKLWKREISSDASSLATSLLKNGRPEIYVA
jgi:hypothetical protein